MDPLYILLALVPPILALSLFYGFRAVYIFGYPVKGQKAPEFNRSWFVHQFWFNFAGSLGGWFLLLLFGFILDELDSISDIGFAPILIFIIGLLGAVGLLPSLLAQIPNVLYFFTKKAAEDVYRGRERTDN